MAGLAKEDFRVLDEGELREIVYFGREREALSLVLLLDLSGSMTRYLKPMAAKAQAALKNLREGDRVAILPFSRRTMTFLEFTSDFGLVDTELRNAIQVTTLGSGTAINPAVMEAAKYIREAADVYRGRRAILIVTDNQGLNYQAPDDQVLRELYAANAVLSAMVVGQGKRPAPLAKGANPDFSPPDVFKLAEETGGEAVKEDKTDVWFPQMLERIRTRYSIQYRAPRGAAPGTFRRVRVELTPEANKKHGRATVRARAGYWVE